MRFEVKNDHIIFQFQNLSSDIKSLFNITEAECTKGTAKIKHDKIAELNIHEIEKLGLPPVYPYRLEIKTRGKPTTSAFSFEYAYIDQKSRKFYQTERTGTILSLDGKKFTLTNPHFIFLKNLEKLSSNIKKPGERLHLWSQIIKTAPTECVLDNKELLDFQFIRSDRFCLDQKKLSTGEFKIIPELIYKEENEEEDESLNHQLPKGVSQEFKEEFLNINDVDPYYKVGSYYIQLSKPLEECLKIVKKINKEPLEKRRAFYMNPVESIKKELPENISEDILENIFFETDHFKSDRISHIGRWVPKIGIYIDPGNKNPWFPKDDIALKIEDNLFHFHPDELNTVTENMEQKKKMGVDTLIYKNQAIPVHNESISIIKKAKNGIIKEAKKTKSKSNKSQSKLSKLVAIIKDNIYNEIYEPKIRKKFNLVKNIPSDLEDKFKKYPYQKTGLLWLQENFICGMPGALLSDDMGLGKTFQTLAFLYWYKRNIKNKKPILIVAPTGLLKNWQDEHQIHLLEFGGLGKKYKAYGESFRKERKNSVLSIVKDMEQSDWILTTYEAVRDHHKDFFIKISWGIIIFDEIQKIKNPNSLMTDAGKALESDFSIGLTGTPIENSFIDLWCISDCLYPKILGLLKDFHNQYIKKKNRFAGQEIQSKLSKKKPPFMLRRMKKDVLDNLPQKKVILERITMTKEQENVYSEIIRKAKNKEYSRSLQTLQLLKRFSLYVQDCFEGSDEQFVQSSSKLKYLFKILENIKSKNEKALISITNRILQKKIKGICSAKWNFTVSVINGEMSGENRKKTVDDFNSTQGFNVMILSPKAGGVGLNITSANHIIHLERWWNPAVEDQCTDRIFRIGQNKPVFIYYPLAVHPEYREESFDVVLNDLLERKRRMREDTLVVSEPDSHERNELYRRVTVGEEMYINNEESFYKSEEWNALRNKTFQKYPATCMRCGNKNNLEVDHVKPRAKYPELELSCGNLQILCRDCNLLKGVKDSIDWDFRTK